MTTGKQKAQAVSPAQAFIKLEQTSIRIYIVLILVLTASVVLIAPTPRQTAQEAQVK
jgi:hypothetical protein